MKIAQNVFTKPTKKNDCQETFLERPGGIKTDYKAQQEENLKGRWQAMRREKDRCHAESEKYYY